MDEIDIDELLECEDIEQTAFISSSKQLLSVIDNVINCIDDRINLKRTGYYGNFMGGANTDEYPHTTGGHFNNNFYGHSKNQSQSNKGRNLGGENMIKSLNTQGDKFDKHRKVSVLY